MCASYASASELLPQVAEADDLTYIGTNFSSSSTALNASTQ